MTFIFWVLLSWLKVCDNIFLDPRFFYQIGILNFRVAVIGKKFESETKEEEKWYGTKYKLEKIPADVIKVCYKDASNID